MPGGSTLIYAIFVYEHSYYSTVQFGLDFAKNIKSNPQLCSNHWMKVSQTFEGLHSRY
jgi:hypothetical protein